MYKDRVDASRQLAQALEKFKDANTVVLSLPRGGRAILVKLNNLEMGL